MKKGYIYITSSGYDPDKGKYLKDPYLGDVPTLGACMPNIRRRVAPGDHIFVISGKIPRSDGQIEIPQYVVAGFEVDEKINVMEAYDRYPELRLKKRDDDQLDGNIIVNDKGMQHPLDTHSMASFSRRVDNYVVGCSPLILETPSEVDQGRVDTLKILQEVLKKRGFAPINIVGRWSRLDSGQIDELNQWLKSIKTKARKR